VFSIKILNFKSALASVCLLILTLNFLGCSQANEPEEEMIEQSIIWAIVEVSMHAKLKLREAEHREKVGKGYLYSWIANKEEKYFDLHEIHDLQSLRDLEARATLLAGSTARNAKIFVIAWFTTGFKREGRYGETSPLVRLTGFSDPKGRKYEFYFNMEDSKKLDVPNLISIGLR